MTSEAFVEWLKEMKAMFLRSSSALAEGDSSFAPVEGMYTVAQQVAQVALTLEWFVEGALSDKEFDLDFEAGEKRVRSVQSLADARKLLDQAFERVIQRTAEMTEEELNQPLPPGPIMGGLPRSTVFGAICDHTAHHRGSLAVYTRLLGKTPPMPYGET